jgi:hypothetical protein
MRDRYIYNNNVPLELLVEEEEGCGKMNADEEMWSLYCKAAWKSQPRR